MSKLYIEKKYGITPNELLNRDDISFKAKGLFAFLQSKPNGWRFSVERIARQTKDGKDSIQSGLKELEKFSYLKRVPTKDKNGKWEGYDYILAEKPFTENPSTGNPSTENPPTLSNIDISKKDISKKDYNKIYIESVFEFWNKQNIIQHRKLTEKIKSKIRSALREYTLEEIQTAIKKYNQVLKGEDYFWTYKWTLPDFLARGLTRFLDTPIKEFKKNGLKTEKKKQPYFQGNPMRRVRDKWFVVVDGEWLEFEGKESDIEWKE